MYIVYKPEGFLNTEIANREKKKLEKKKVCICGKLDPMAKGELLLLFDEECKLMNSYLSKRKIYQWDILWGIKTDTDDALGLIINEKTININKNIILNIINNFIGTYEQNFHHYSAINVSNNLNERKPLWKWSMDNKLSEIEIPKKLVNVEYIKIIDTKKIKFDIIKKDIIDTIKKVNGNFRQEKIIKQWNNYSNKELYISSFEANVSSGFYIRELVKQIGILTKYLGITLNINRTKILI